MTKNRKKSIRDLNIKCDVCLKSITKCDCKVFTCSVGHKTRIPVDSRNPLYCPQIVSLNQRCNRPLRRVRKHD